MTSGSMIIPNFLGQKTVLIVNAGKAEALPPENALADARAELSRQEHNASPSSGNINFLKEWIRCKTNPPSKEQGIKSVFSSATAVTIPGSPSIQKQEPKQEIKQGSTVHADSK